MPQNAIFSRSNKSFEEEIIQQRADGTILYFQFLEEVNGAEEISLFGKPPDDRRGMPLRCRLTAHNLGILDSASRTSMRSRII